MSKSGQYLLFTPTLKEASAIAGTKTIVTKDGFQGILWQDYLIITTGPGKTNAAATVSRYLSTEKYDKSKILVLAGIAGVYQDTPLAVGDVCLIRDDYFADEALFTGDTLIGTDEMGFPVCENNKISCHIIDTALPVCDSNTVSMISGTKKLAHIYQKKTGAWTESMEGASFALAASYFGLKTIQIRAISNYCGDKQEWNAKKALKNLQKAMESLFGQG